jgi:hypothetical protein
MIRVKPEADVGLPSFGELLGLPGLSATRITNFIVALALPSLRLVSEGGGAVRTIVRCG